MNTTSQATSTYADQQILQDSLICEKHMTDSYNLYAGECVNEQLRTTMLDILNDVHTIQSKIFSTMQSNGWYQVEPAEQQKIQQARQKFQAS
ncbi:Coat F domain-containing protein [Sporobacter termitidis DSM 10068]|uniref:Coat F domain-containing protein n=1 Tax=Sporobacter termitidis DSM 10068 TaxID=1123282 RepID=A0A1M5WEL4_9FIRM|nr:spore coat protein [Sporobacter termitidis]SHH85932.1 Coat F domain-containing protein [Sporobacter termitidis DSM 10068]